MSKGPDTLACSIIMSFLVMNLKMAESHFLCAVFWLSDRADVSVKLLGDIKSGFEAIPIIQLPAKYAEAMARR